MSDAKRAANGALDQLFGAASLLWDLLGGPDRTELAKAKPDPEPGTTTCGGILSDVEWRIPPEVVDREPAEAPGLGFQSERAKRSEPTSVIETDGEEVSDGT